MMAADDKYFHNQDAAMQKQGNSEQTTEQAAGKSALFGRLQSQSNVQGDLQVKVVG